MNAVNDNKYQPNRLDGLIKRGAVKLGNKRIDPTGKVVRFPGAVGVTVGNITYI